jgi:hypothetical protein
VAEARVPQEALRRPWHGASDRSEDPAVVVIRLHRAEVEAVIAYRRTVPGSEEQSRAWRRVAALREKRVALMPAASAERLPPLPAAPTTARAQSTWQKLRRRLGLARG